MTAVKVVKVIGTSSESWEAAAKEALDRANDTLDDVRGIEVESWTASVEGDEIVEYRATVELAFPVHDRAS
jgi:flavin-binding protein dodecin